MANKLKEMKKLDRRDVVGRLVAARGDGLLVTGLGAPTWDAAAAGDHHNHFYMWGGMGGAAMVGLGLALAQPRRRVLVITGDGEMLMGLGSLATVAARQPANLAICVIDNERYGETGMQETHTAWGVDLAAIAAGAGFRQAVVVRNDNEFGVTVRALWEAEGPVFAAVKVGTGAAPMVLPPRDGTFLKDRFRGALLSAAERAGR